MSGLVSVSATSVLVLLSAFGSSDMSGLVSVSATSVPVLLSAFGSSDMSGLVSVSATSVPGTTVCFRLLRYVWFSVRICYIWYVAARYAYLSAFGSSDTSGLVSVSATSVPGTTVCFRLLRYVWFSVRICYICTGYYCLLSAPQIRLV